MSNATNDWKRRKFELDGLCLNCNQRPANEPGGTRTTCAICAEKKRINECKRQERLDPGKLPVWRARQHKPAKITKTEKQSRPDRKKVQSARIDLMCRISERLAALDRLRA